MPIAFLRSLLPGSPACGTLRPAAAVLAQPGLIAAALGLLSLGIYAAYGFDGWLWRDDAVYLYAGRELAAGVAPYVSIFDHKTPLSQLLCGWGWMMAEAMGTEPILTVRALFGVLTGLTVSGLYLLGQALFRRWEAALLTAVSLVPVWAYGRPAFAGPQAKTPFLCAEVFCFYFLARGRWFWAGVMAALATWTWQPGGLFCLLVLGLAWWQAEPSARRSALKRAALGIGLPTVPLFVWFAAQGAFGALWEGAVRFNLSLLDRGPALPWSERLRLPLLSLERGYASTYWLLVAGFLTFLACYALRRRDLRPGPQLGGMAGLLLAFPGVFLWSAKDFQGAADFYPFLPFACVGLGGLTLALLRLPEIWDFPPRLRALGVALGALALLAFGFWQYRTTADAALRQQRAWAAEIEATYPGVPLRSIGNPEALLLLNRRNPDRYVFIIAGIDRLIDREHPGGFAGWLDDLEREKPVLLLWGETEGDHLGELLAWRDAHYAPRDFGYWRVYVRVQP